MGPQEQVFSLRRARHGLHDAAVRARLAFGCAFVDGDSVYVTGTKESSEVHMFVSKDLEHWDDFPHFAVAALEDIQHLDLQGGRQVRIDV